MMRFDSASKRCNELWPLDLDAGCAAAVLADLAADDDDAAGAAVLTGLTDAGGAIVLAGLADAAIGGAALETDLADAAVGGAVWADLIDSDPEPRAILPLLTDWGMKSGTS
jgi:hypothetical protein